MTTPSKPRPKAQRAKPEIETKIERDLGAVSLSIEDIKPEPEQSARLVGLRYVSDEAPGISRLKSGKGFRYVGPDGQPVRDKDNLARIKSLAIPPAYREVWICAHPKGHIQATGVDERGRKQYRYHARWHEVRDEAKYARMIAFGAALPLIRERAESDLRKAGMPREKVLAILVQLLEKTAIRIGNEEYARAPTSRMA